MWQDEMETFTASVNSMKDANMLLPFLPIHRPSPP